MKDEDGLTERQREVYTFLCESTRENGYQPDIREMCAHFGWRSTNSAADHLKALERKRLICLTGRARAIEFIGGPPWAENRGPLYGMDIIANSTPTEASITFVDNGFSRCTASANIYHSDSHENCWWISRVLVNRNEDRGKGYGGEVLDRLLLEIENQGGKSAIVTPGGYGADPKKQIKFYEAHGFVKVGDTAYEQYWLWTASAP